MLGQREYSIPFLTLEGHLPEGTSICGQRSRARFEFAVQEKPLYTPFSHSVRFPPLLFWPTYNTQQNSLLFYLDVRFSGKLCHPYHLLVFNFPPLVPTTRENMSAAQNNVSPNINLAMETRKTSLPNLSYPIRPVHTPWVESSVPLVVKACYSQWTLLQLSNFFFVQKTESFRYQTNFVYSNGSSGVSTNNRSYFSPAYPLFSSLPPPMTRPLSCQP